VHQLIDGDPRILDDTIIVPLLGAESVDGALERCLPPPRRIKTASAIV
jgi:hypothetical protein